MVKILTIIPTLKDIPLRSIASLLAQTIRPQKIIIVSGSRHIQRYLMSTIVPHIPIEMEAIYVMPDMQEHVGVRVGKAINTALKNENIKLYDYILKMDSDVILHPTCLEKCIKKDADLIGLGSFMLIKTKPFITILSGRWPEVPADDSYIRLAFTARGLKVEPTPPEVIEVRKGGTYGNWKYYFYRGFDNYRLGINPILMNYIVLRLMVERRTLLPVFAFVGYFVALIKQVEYFDFATTIFKTGLLKIMRAALKL